MGLTVLGGIVLSIIVVVYMYKITRRQRDLMLDCEQANKKMDELYEKYTNKEDRSQVRPISGWDIDDVEKYSECNMSIYLSEREYDKLAKKTKLMYLPLGWILIVGVAITGAFATDIAGYGQVINRYPVEYAVFEEATNCFTLSLGERGVIVVPMDIVVIFYDVQENPYAILTERLPTNANFWHWQVKAKFDAVELHLLQ